MCWNIGPCNRLLLVKKHRPSILHVLEHRALHQDFKRKTSPGCGSGLPAHEHHRKDDAPNAAKAAGAGGGVAAGTATGGGVAAGDDDEPAAGAGTVKTLGAPAAAPAVPGASGLGGVGVGALTLAPTLGSAPTTARHVSHATSSGGFGGRRSGASPRVFTACFRLPFTNLFS